WHEGIGRLRDVNFLRDAPRQVRVNENCQRMRRVLRDSIVQQLTKPEAQPFMRLGRAASSEHARSVLTLCFNRHKLAGALMPCGEVSVSAPGVPLVLSFDREF